MQKSSSLIWKMIVIIVIICAFVIINMNIDKQNYIKDNTFTSMNEYLRTIDCASLFDANPNCSFVVSFEASVNVDGDVMIYCQNGSSSRYSFCNYIHMTPEMRHYEVEITPILVDAETKEAFISFYGTYGTGVIPTVQFISVDPVGRSN